MVAVLKVEQMDPGMSLRDIRQVFKDHNARPCDIHLVVDPNNQRTGSAFLSFANKESARNGLNVDGLIYNNQRMIVRESNPSEFNRFFPGVSLISKVPKTSQGRGGLLMTSNVARNPGNQERPFPIQQRPAIRGRPNFRGRGRPMPNNSRQGFDHSFEARNREDNNLQDRRDRSRSPVDRKDRQRTRESFLQNFAKQERKIAESRGESSQRRSERSSREDKSLPPYHNPLENLNVKKFVRIAGLPYDVSEVEIQKFFRPVLSRDVFFLKHASGKHAGKPNGCAIVEFFSESDAKQSLKLDGKKFGLKSAYVTSPEKDEIISAVQGRLGNVSSEEVEKSKGSVPDLGNLANLASNNPQVAHLLNLLTETVNAIAGAAVSGSQHKEKMNTKRGRHYESNRQKGSRKGADPVVKRVANSANIDERDITMGKVVGIRHLPYSVTPGEIMQFFEGYHVKQDSVRIHYLDNGHCSGDAIVSFRGKDDARAAVARLNKKKIAGRNIELFFL